MGYNHNKYNFNVGDDVVLDKEFRNSSIVKIVRLSQPHEMFATVSAESNE